MNEYIEQLDFLPDFEQHMSDKDAAWTDRVSIMQINVGSLCNQACKHCHVEGGPGRTDAVMGRDVMKACLEVFAADPDLDTIDITGGAPEMNPDFEWLIREAAAVCDHVMVRCNLTILDDERYAHFAELYRDLGIEIVSSLPYYTKKDTDRQRGDDVFDKSIRILQKFNSLGYGREPGLVLNLVYNPGGAFLPPAQEAIERDFRIRLAQNYGIEFNNLFAITNNPVGRFGKFLARSGNLERYMNKLLDSYNPGAEAGMMCRYQVSVGYDGMLYDCDFNQAAELPAEGVRTIFEAAEHGLGRRRIMLANHCYACTAGQGSSCGGATN